MIIRLIGLVWPDQQFSHVNGGSCAFSLFPSWLYSTSICWNSFGDGWWAHAVTWVYGAVLTALFLFGSWSSIFIIFLCCCCSSSCCAIDYSIIQGGPKNLAPFFLKMCCYRSCLVFNCCFYDTDSSQGSVATHLRYGGSFIKSIITYFLVILTMK